MSIFGFGGGKPPATNTSGGRRQTNSPVSAPGPTSTAIGSAAGKAQPRNPTVGSAADTTTPKPPDAVAASAGAADAARQASIRARKRGVGRSAETMLAPGGAATPGARLSGRTLLGY
jgi:hypothetical protein